MAQNVGNIYNPLFQNPRMRKPPLVAGVDRPSECRFAISTMVMHAVSGGEALRLHSLRNARTITCTPLCKGWNILTEPSPKVLEPGERRSARTLACFVLLGLALMPLVLSSTYSSAGIYREARSFIILLVIPQFGLRLSRSRYYRAGVLLEAFRFWAGIIVTMTLVPGDRLHSAFYWSHWRSVQRCSIK